MTGEFFKSGETVPRAVQLLYEVRRLATPEPVVIIVDGLTDSGIAHDWFGRLRDELWELGHTWVLAARPVDSAAFRTPPADAFWSVVLELGPLTRRSATRCSSAAWSQRSEPRCTPPTFRRA